jgi:hypothetical protein
MEKINQIDYYLEGKRINGIPLGVTSATIIYSTDGKKCIFYDVENGVENANSNNNLRELAEDYLKRFRRANSRIPKTQRGIEKMMKRFEKAQVDNLNF